jgi:hypothetical protein
VARTRTAPVVAEAGAGAPVVPELEEALA